MTRPERNEDGMTLIEAMFTIILVSVAFATLLGGLWTAVVASDFNVKQATAESSARAFSEYLKRDGAGLPTEYSNCAITTTYDYSTFLSPGFTPAITEIRYWSEQSSSFGPSCPPDGGLQLITVTLTSTDNRASATLDFVKRRSRLS